jgi:hypothetical protein
VQTPCVERVHVPRSLLPVAADRLLPSVFLNSGGTDPRQVRRVADKLPAFLEASRARISVAPAHIRFDHLRNMRRAHIAINLLARDLACPLTLGVGEKQEFHNDAAMQQEHFCSAAVHVCGRAIAIYSPIVAPKESQPTICSSRAGACGGNFRELPGSKRRGVGSVAC